MTNLDNVNDRPNGHDANRRTDNAKAQCPYCGQPISRKEFREIQARIQTEERTRIADVEKMLKDRFASEKAKTEAQGKAAIEKAQKDAMKFAEAKIKAVAASHDAVVAARLEAQRIRLENKTAEAIVTERTKMFAEKAALEQQLADMQRRLQAKTAHQIGEPAEVDLFDALVAAFPDDRISRVVKGQKGPDVIVEVVHGGDVVGKIVLDSKAHARWSNRFTAKLHEDCIREGGSFSILSTSVFPAGAQHLHIQDNVIVATPARVPVLVHLLRRQIIENHRLRLTTAARDEKAERLLTYIVSPGCTDLLDKIAKLTADMATLDATETAAHQKTWTRRADLIRGVQAVHNEFSSAVSAIIGGEL
jgi:hypothetical protein